MSKLLLALVVIHSSKNLKDLAHLLSIPRCKDIIFGVLKCFYPFFLFHAHLFSIIAHPGWLSLIQHLLFTFSDLLLELTIFIHKRRNPVLCFIR